MATVVLEASAMRRNDRRISLPPIVLSGKATRKKEPTKKKKARRRVSHDDGVEIKQIYSRRDSFEFRKRIEQYKQWQKEHIDDKLKIFKEEVKNVIEQEAMRVSRTIVHIETSLKHKHNQRNVDNEKIRPANISVFKKVPKNTIKVHDGRWLSDSSVESEEPIDRKLLMSEEKEKWIIKWLEEVEVAKEATGITPRPISGFPQCYLIDS